jgi:hypothetical protein
MTYGVWSTKLVVSDLRTLDLNATAEFVKTTVLLETRRREIALSYPAAGLK